MAVGKKRKSRKKNNDTKIGVIILVGAALVAWYLYSQVRRVSVGGASFRIHKVTLGGIELRIFLVVINEGNLKLDVQNFLGQVFYKGTALGIVSQIAPVELQPFQTGEIEFKANLSLTSIGLELFQLIQNKQFDANSLTIAGTLKAEGISIPIKEKLLTA